MELLTGGHVYDLHVLAQVIRDCARHCEVCRGHHDDGVSDLPVHVGALLLWAFQREVVIMRLPHSHCMVTIQHSQQTPP